MDETGTLIVGAGLAGLSCARRLASGYVLVEKETRPGGACRTENRRGYTIDHTGHYLHFADPKVMKSILRVLGRNLITRNRDSRVHLAGREGGYPFQTNLCGHDPKIVRECIVGLFTASARKPPKAGDSFRDWILKTQGPGIAKHFMFPFNSKQFRVPLSMLTPEQGGRFLPRPQPDDIVAGAIGHRGRSGGYNVKLWYPRRHGIEALPRALAADLRAGPLCGSGVRRIWWKSREAELDSGKVIRYGQLVSTAPLPELVGMLRPRVTEASTAAARLRWIGVITIHGGISHPLRRRRHWVYCPERRYAFFRYGFPSNINSALAPSGRCLVSAEISYLPGRRPAAHKLLSMVKAGLVELGEFKSPREFDFLYRADLPIAYVLFDRSYREARALLLRFLARANILSIGRYGAWNYSSMEDAMRDGYRAAGIIGSYGRRSGSKFAENI